MMGNSVDGMKLGAAGDNGPLFVCGGPFDFIHGLAHAGPAVTA